MSRHITIIVLLLATLLNGCLYETTDLQPEPAAIASENDQTMNFNERSATGSLIPGGNAMNRVVLQCPFPTQENYTVQFKVRDPNDQTTLNPSGYVRSRATITWTVSGNPVSRIVDVGDGVSVSGTAEHVNVEVIDDSVAPGTSALPYEVTIVAAKGVRATVEQPPTLALIRDSIAPGTSVLFDIPKDAGVISVNVAIAPALGGTIAQYQVLVNHFAQGVPLKTYDPRQMDWVPVMPGTTQIRVVADAALATNVLVQVTFGVDG
jgi:hypothetical protein